MNTVYFVTVFEQLVQSARSSKGRFAVKKNVLIDSCLLITMLLSGTASAEKFAMCDEANFSPMHQLKSTAEGCEIEITAFGRDALVKEDCSLMLEIFSDPNFDIVSGNSLLLLEVSKATSLAQVSKALKVNSNCDDEFAYLAASETLSRALSSLRLVIE